MEPAPGRANWRWLFEGYEATVDVPACFYFEELMREFPEARVVLTVRDLDRWYQSVTALSDSVQPLRPLRHVIPRLRHFLELVDALMQKFVSPTPDRESSLAAARRHVEAVKRIVPPERLLVFDVQQGWEPLCLFLGCEAPSSGFPHLNEAASVRERLSGMFQAGPRRAALAAAALDLVAAIAWLLA